MLGNLWLVPVWPLLGFLANGFFGRRIGKRAVGMIACGSVGLSLLFSLLAVAELLALPHGARVEPGGGALDRARGTSRRTGGCSWIRCRPS